MYVVCFVDDVDVLWMCGGRIVDDMYFCRCGRFVDHEGGWYGRFVYVCGCLPTYLPTWMEYCIRMECDIKDTVECGRV